MFNFAQSQSPLDMFYQWEAKIPIESPFVSDPNADLDSHARIAAVLITQDEWNSANGLVTHTLKIKRSALEKRYRSLAEGAFDLGASAKVPLVIWESDGELNARLRA